jgi:hypothetical protein
MDKASSQGLCSPRFFGFAFAIAIVISIVFALVVLFFS